MSTYSAIAVAAALEDFAIKYGSPDFIADLVCPIKDSSKRTAKYFKYARRDMGRITDSKVTSTGLPNQRHFATTTEEYTVELHALFDYVAHSDIAAQDAPLDLESDTVEDLTHDLLLGREKRVADLYTTAANFPTANKVTLTVPWTDYTLSTPIKDIQTGKRACALPANIMVLDEISWDTLAAHPAIISGLRNFGGAKDGLARPEEVASYFGFENVYVGKMKYDTADPGQTESFSTVWPQGKVVIARVPKSPRTKEAMLGRNFRFNGEGAENGVAVDLWDDRKRGTKGGVLGIKVSMEEVPKIVASDCGYLISSAA